MRECLGDIFEEPFEKDNFRIIQCKLADFLFHKSTRPLMADWPVHICSHDFFKQANDKTT